MTEEEVAALRARVAELESREANVLRSELVQAALFRIAELANTASDLPRFYAEVHRIVGGLLDARNFYIALWDAARGALNFPYFVDEIDLDAPDPSAWEAFGTGNAGGLTAYVIRTAEPQLVTRERWHELARVNEIAEVGRVGEDWLGVPLRVGDQIVGVLVVQTYDEGLHYSPDDLELLAYVGTYVAVALERTRLVGAQRDTELRYRSLIEALPLAVYLDDPDSAFVYMSPQAESIFGHPPDAWLRKGFFASAVHDEDRGRVLAEIEANLAGDGARWSLDYRLRRASGDLAWVRDEAYIVRDDAGRAVYAQGYLQDVTEQVKARSDLDAAMQAMEVAERRYRRLIEELPMAVYTDKPDATGTSTYISPRVVEMFGYPREAWLQEEHFRSVLHPEDRERVLADRRGEIGGASARASDEYRIVAADGRTVWVRDDQWIVRDEHGAALYIQGFMIDVTNQKVAEAELARQKQYFQALVEISPVAVVTMDHGETVSGWNPAATRLFGYAADEAIGRNIDDLVLRSEQLVEEGHAMARQAATTGEVHRITQRMRKDGELVDVEMVVVPLVMDDQHVGFYAIYHDISELVAARRQADAANAAKGAFLAAMSHEIRTPMNAIIGMSGLLVDTPLDDEQRDYAETIRTSGDALLTIINDILDFSKIEAGRVELEAEPFSPRATIEGALDVLVPTAAARGVELLYAVDDDLPARIVGDAGRLRQIVLNLLSNAVKFTDTGEVELRAVGAPVGQDTDGLTRWEITIEVRDTGIGIPSDRMGRLFQSFSQADASTSRRYGGTGLGLAISLRLAELMDGTLTAESSGVPGEGSRFRLVMRGTEPAAGSEPAPIAILSVDLAGRRVLIVDDNATNRRILVAQVARWGLTAQETGSPVEALGWLRDGQVFDIALVDLHMPELDGYELADAARAALGTATPPVVILSSLGVHDRMSPAVQAHLVKPVKPSALLDTLVTVLAGRAVAVPVRSADRPSLDPEMAAGHPLRILLAEDNPVNQKLAIRLLRQLGYAADLATNGVEVLEALEQATYDVVLMDVQMPELDGLEATRRIRARWQDDGPRVVAMTANAMAEDRQACLEAGMDDYVSKPIRPGALVAALEATPAGIGGTARA